MSDDPQASPQSEPSSTTLSEFKRWRCPNCGQLHFTLADELPPDVCHYCRDMTTWQSVPEDERTETRR